MSEDEWTGKVFLEGGAAIHLWRQGYEAWNSWVIKHPEADIDFSFLSFSNIHEEDQISFAGYRFPKGDVLFVETDFGDRNVSFEHADFGDGSVYFHKAKFGKGLISFAGAKFGEGDFVFYDAQFGAGSLILDGVHVCGRFDFRPDTFKATQFRAGVAIFRGFAVFEFGAECKSMSSLVLGGAAFNGWLGISGEFVCVPDLIGTKSDHHVDLSGMKHKLNRKSKWSWPKWLHFIDPSYIVIDSEDRARLQRLKELAEANRDHTAALRFAADENRAARWKDRGWFASTLDLAFSAVSNYGQSIARPFTTLVVFGIACAAAFFWMSDKAVNEAFGFWDKLGEAGLLSLGNTVAFIPQTRTIREDALKHLYGMDANVGVDALIIAQAVGAFILLFLIGLGIRNRFRL